MFFSAEFQSPGPTASSGTNLPPIPWLSFAVDQNTGNIYVKPNQAILDAAELAPIYAESFAGPPWYENWTLPAATAELNKLIDIGGDFIVGYSQNLDLLGFGVGYALEDYQGADELIAQGLLTQEQVNRSYYISELCTSPAARGQGVCTNVLQDLLKLAWDSGFSDVVTRTRVDNENMIRIFKRAGFVEIGRYSTSTGGVDSERVVLRKAMP